MIAINTIQLPDREGFQLEAKIYPDSDSQPSDSDCYTDIQIADWCNDDWSFVGVVVTASMAGVPLGEASCWGVEYGLDVDLWTDAHPKPDGWTPYKYAEQEMPEELADEAISAARVKLAQLVKASLEEVPA